MRNKAVIWIVIIAISLLVLFVTVLGLQGQDRQILNKPEKQIEFTSAEKAYLADHHTVKIAVEKDLQYLIDENGSGYLPDYLNRVLAPAGLRPVFEGHGDGDAEEEEEPDCTLRIVTPRVRENMKGLSFTAPLFEVEGRLFVGEAKGNALRVKVLSQRMTDQKLRKLTYLGKPLSYTGADSVEELIAAAAEGSCEGIIGDEGAVDAALTEAGLRKSFVPAEKSLYRCNACILVDGEDSILGQILNQCIQDCDRHNLSYEMSEKWLDGKGPVFMAENHRETYLPVFIVILAVLISFFVYYLTNRSMYQELNDRMDQITESRNEMQTTFHGVGHYMAELSPAGDILDLNRAFAEDIPVVQLHRRIWEILELADEDRDHLRQMVEHAAEGMQDPRFEAGIGKRVFVMDVFPVDDARGDVGRLLFMAIDVTQERMAKRQMLQDNKMIAIGQLAAGVAHEIRNPLGIIRNYCYVLKTMEDEEVRAKAIEEIEKAVDVSGGIINNLLDFSRISPGRVEEIDVESHIRTILALNEAAFRSSGIELTVSCPEPVRTYIAMEPFDMVLLNLVKNAADAVDDGGKIGINIKRVNEDMFTIEVEDNGIGIEEEALEEIFNPFYTTKGNKGTGLGLYIVYSETEKMDGEIEVSSRPGEGTTFCISLPVRQERAKEEM